MIPRKIKNKLEKMGIPLVVYKRLIKLSNANFSKRLFCDVCFERLYQSGKYNQMDPKLLIDRVCDKCKDNVEHFLKSGEVKC